MELKVFEILVTQVISISQLVELSLGIVVHLHLGLYWRFPLLPVDLFKVDLNPKKNVRVRCDGLGNIKPGRRSNDS